MQSYEFVGEIPQPLEVTASAEDNGAIQAVPRPEPAEQKTRTEMWEQNEAEVKAMLGLEELPRQRITAGEWQRYSEKIATGDTAATEELFMRNLRRIYGTAKSFHRNFASNELNIEDHFQHAAEGFYAGVERFSTKGGSLKEEVGFGIYRGLTRNAAHSGLIVNMSTLEKIQAYNKQREEALEALGPSASEEAMLGYLTGKYYTDLDNIEEIKYIKQADYEEILPIEDAAETADPEYEDYDVADRAFSNIASTRLRETMEEVLDDRSQRVLKMRYSLDDEQPSTYDEVGMELGVTRERIRQIENQNLKKLQMSEKTQRLNNCKLVQLVERRRPIIASDDPRERAMARRLGFRAMRHATQDDELTEEEQARRDAIIGASPVYTRLKHLVN